MKERRAAARKERKGPGGGDGGSPSSLRLILAEKTFSPHNSFVIVLPLPSLYFCFRYNCDSPTTKSPNGAAEPRYENTGAETKQIKNIKSQQRGSVLALFLPVKESADLSQEGSACPLSRDRVKMEEIHERNQR